MAEDIRWVQTHLPHGSVQVKIINNSFFQYRTYLPPQSVDLIVTSPPYLNNYHYNRNTRPHLYWLGYAQGPEDLRPLEEANFGKFWQTVREHKCIDLDFEMSDSEISGQLKKLRKLHPEKGIYGGNGWANYAASYFNDCYRFT